jgi:hypothetical protein
VSRSEKRFKPNLAPGHKFFRRAPRPQAPRFLLTPAVPEYISGTARGVGAMRWFQKTQVPEIWEVVDARPLGDIEAAQRIREICASAGSIAEKMTGAAGRNAEQEKAAATERYQAAIKRALEIAMKISDDSMRDVAVCQIIVLCVKVDHMKTARILVRAIKSEAIRTELIDDNTALRS